jgi:hypothetical protein
VVVAEGFFIHKRHEHIIRGGASVDVVIDVYIIIIILLNIVVVATKLRCNGFVLNIVVVATKLRCNGFVLKHKQ